MRALHRVYTPAVRRSRCARPKRALAFGARPDRASCVVLFPLLGGEFMPKLEEGNFWIRATLPMSISLEQSAKYVGRMRASCAAARRPERRRATTRTGSTRRSPTVVSQLGRPDDGTDVSGFYNIELFAPLKPFDEWPRGLTKEKLTDELEQGAAARRSRASSSTSRR